MIDVLWAAQPGLSTALLAKGAKLYIEGRDANAVLPHALFEGVDEAKAVFYGHAQTTARLHLWAANPGVLRDMEEAVSYLDDYHIPAGYGKAVFLTFKMQTKQRVIEPDAIHTVIDYLVDFADKRKLS